MTELVEAERGVAQLGSAESMGRASREAPRADGTLPGQFIVVFEDGVADAPSLARRLVAAHGGTLGATYGATIKGFAARLPDQAITALRRTRGVAHVEPDRVVSAGVTQSMDTLGNPWGLDRIDERWLPMSRTYSYVATGAGVRVYILDTGLETTHPEFGTRARNVATVYFDDAADCNGHGTHVAGIVGGRTFGVAKGALLRGVKVLGGDCTSGTGPLSGIIAAIDWVAANRVDPAVANMSFGGPFISEALDSAVNRLVASGVFVSVSGGNDNKDACTYSPASASDAFTVGATTRTDYKASYSNFGACLDAYAPGSSIQSSYLGGTVKTMSGTSMAAPHVAGVAALYRQKYGTGATPAAITAWLKANNTPGLVKGNVVGTPNRLLYKGAL